MKQTGRAEKWVQWLLILLLIAGMRPIPVRADIYKYIDSEGVIHFTNVPTASEKDFRLYLRERHAPRFSSPAKNRFDPMIHRAAARHGLDFRLLKALIKVESDFNPRAVSKSGALGLTQIMPENLEQLRVVDPFDPWQNILGGARYLNQMLERFGGKLHLALAAYNAGPNLVARYDRIPPIRETENFVQKVMRYYSALEE
jgi:soluble lytic murein transglycosylase-like protein